MTLEEQGRFGTTDRLDLHWYAWRCANPKARVLIVHGLGDHAGRYRELALALAQHGCASMAYDQRGHGRSPGPRGHAAGIDVLIDDLRAARGEIDALLGTGTPLILLGHSMGGLLALDFLGEPGHRVDIAVLSAPWLATLLPVPGWKRVLGRALDTVWPQVGLSTGHDADALTRDRAMAQAYDEDLYVHDRISPRLFLEVERAQVRVLERAPNLNVEALFLIPEADPIVRGDVTAEYAESMIEAATTVRWLAGSRHEPFNELDREELYREVGRWIEHRVGRWSRTQRSDRG